MSYSNVDGEEVRFIITVDDGGYGDYTRIQDAIDNASDGAVIYVYNGSYYESLDIINKDIQLIGLSYERFSPNIKTRKPWLYLWWCKDAAVYINNSQVTITNFTIEGRYNYGIRVFNSNNLIISNTFLGFMNKYAIELSNTSFCKLYSNKIDNVEKGAIKIINSNNNSISNTIFQTSIGIFLKDSLNHEIYENSFRYGGIGIEGTNIHHWTSHNISVDNIKDGNPIRFYKNDNGIIVPQNTSQVICANCSNFTIKNLVLDSSVYNILLGYSTNNSIHNNSIGYASYDEDGIRLDHSSFNIISNNKIRGIQESGICLIDSSNNSIENNTLSIPYSPYGIKIIEKSNMNQVNNNTINGSKCGIQIYGSNNNTISNNDILQIKMNRIVLQNSSNNIIGNNTIKNTKGSYYFGYSVIMLINDSHQNFIIENTIDCGYQGLYINTSYNQILNNIITDFYKEGMRIQESTFNYIGKNHICYNGGEGIIVEGGDMNFIIKNSIYNNSLDGIKCIDTTKNVFSGNDIFFNENKGIHLPAYSVSSDNNIWRNNIHDNVYGIFIHNLSYDNVIYHNNIFDNGVNAVDEGSNAWYSESEQVGNYWGDYEEKNPDAKKRWLKGVWGTEYNVSGFDSLNYDLYPLIVPFVTSNLLLNYLYYFFIIYLSLEPPQNPFNPY
jgi:parallel beta-helix repeat protein